MHKYKPLNLSFLSQKEQEIVDKSEKEYKAELQRRMTINHHEKQYIGEVISNEGIRFLRKK